MRIALLPVAALASTVPAQAQTLRVKPLLDARLRWEHLAQDDTPKAADAVTLRVRPGIVVDEGDLSLLVEGEATAAIVDRYFDGIRGSRDYALIADPHNAELNRAQLSYKNGMGWAVTAGRQRIELEDRRFVSSAVIRQNEQTFDAVRIQYEKPKGLGVDLTYAWSVRTVDGRNGQAERPTSVDGRNLFALAHYGLGAGRLSAFAYLIDRNDPALSGYRQSSQSYGVRFTGTAKPADQVKLDYSFSWALQEVYRNNPNRYSANYMLASADLNVAALQVGASYEVMGADDGRPWTSFQTPYAATFRFNGLAGRFVTTPADGLRDANARIGYSWKDVGGLNDVQLSASYHRYRSDRLSRHYGDELNLVASAKLNARMMLTTRYARYAAARFASDTDRFWLQLDFKL